VSSRPSGYGLPQPEAEGSLFSSEHGIKARIVAKHSVPLAISLESRYYLDMLRFDWDERKNKRNRTKHGVWFEEAQSVFSDPHARLFYDPEHSEGEDRFILLGVSSAARTLVVIHCYGESDSAIRIISARKATRKEVRFYEEAI
jgi:uncharacterized protein